MTGFFFSAGSATRRGASSPRREVILYRVELDSVIEGLPRFDESFRSACLREMESFSA